MFILNESSKQSKTGGSVKESKHFFAKDVAPRWASNHGPFHGNYRTIYYITPGDGSFHAISGQIKNQSENFPKK